MLQRFCSTDYNVFLQLCCIRVFALVTFSHLMESSYMSVLSLIMLHVCVIIDLIAKAEPVLVQSKAGRLRNMLDFCTFMTSKFYSAEFNLFKLMYRYVKQAFGIGNIRFIMIEVLYSWQILCKYFLHPSFAFLIHITLVISENCSS